MTDTLFLQLQLNTDNNESMFHASYNSALTMINEHNIAIKSAYATGWLTLSIGSFFVLTWHGANTIDLPASCWGV